MSVAVFLTVADYVLPDRQRGLDYKGDRIPSVGAPGSHCDPQNLAAPFLKTILKSSSVSQACHGDGIKYWKYSFEKVAASSCGLGMHEAPLLRVCSYSLAGGYW